MEKLKVKLKKTKLGVFYYQLIRLYYSKKYAIPRNDILQLANTTEYNRHEDLFSLAQKTIGKEKQIKILSFGCSTGEECYSLRQYFPNAFIVGCDINKNSLNIARSRNKDSKMEFIISNNSNISKFKNFDLILANSVLMKLPISGINNISKLFPFNQFNEIIGFLDSCLNTHGLFIMRYANYRFEDTFISFKYKNILQKDSSFPIFDKEGIQLKNNNIVGEVFVKCNSNSEEIN